MNSYITFVLKEIKEQMRTYKAFVLFIVLLFFGITSPVLAKLMPDLFEAFKKMDNSIQIVMNGNPTYMDAYGQYFKNISQTALFVVLLVFSSIVSQEKLKGTGILMLTKKLSRKTFILSKFTAMSISWTVCFAVSSLTTMLYTLYLFPEGSLHGVLAAMLCLWLFVELILAITLLASTLSTNFFICAICAFGGWIVLGLTTSIPKIKSATPALLGSMNLSLIDSTKSLGSLWPAIVTCILLTALALWLSCYILKKQEL